MSLASSARALSVGHADPAGDDGRHEQITPDRSAQRGQIARLPSEIRKTLVDALNFRASDPALINRHDALANLTPYTPVPAYIRLQHV